MGVINSSFSDHYSHCLETKCSTWLCLPSRAGVTAPGLWICEQIRGSLTPGFIFGFSQLLSADLHGRTGASGYGEEFLVPGEGAWSGNQRWDCDWQPPSPGALQVGHPGWGIWGAVTEEPLCHLPSFWPALCLLHLCRKVRRQQGWAGLRCRAQGSRAADPTRATTELQLTKSKRQHKLFLFCLPFHTRKPRWAIK